MRIYCCLCLEGVTIVDGMVVTGSNTLNYKLNLMLSTAMYLAPLRWSVNYTTDFKEWIQFRNKQGEVHVRDMAQYSLL